MVTMDLAFLMLSSLAEAWETGYWRPFFEQARRSHQFATLCRNQSSWMVPMFWYRRKPPTHSTECCHSWVLTTKMVSESRKTRLRKDQFYTFRSCQLHGKFVICLQYSLFLILVLQSIKWRVKGFSLFSLHYYSRLQRIFFNFTFKAYSSPSIPCNTSLSSL